MKERKNGGDIAISKIKKLTAKSALHHKINRLAENEEASNNRI